MTCRLCRITVAGVLSERFETAFDGLRLERAGATTVLRGAVRDSSALYGVIGRLQDLGLELLAVESRPLDPQDLLTDAGSPARRGAGDPDGRAG